jgi:hypothetical protein
VHGPRVGDLARPVDPDEPSRVSVSPRVEGEDRVAPAREAVALDERVHLLAVPGEAVQEDDGGPTSGGRRAVRQVERRGDRDAVVHRDRDVQLCRWRSGGVADEEGERACQRR